MIHNILYIEDNPDNTTLVRRALEARGYKLLHAPNGVKGVLLAEAEEVSLILLDINLPDIDGYGYERFGTWLIQGPLPHQFVPLKLTGFRHAQSHQ